MIPSYGYYKEVFRGRPMPFAYVDLDLFDANCASLAKRAAGKSLRVASKSVRCLALLKRILASNAVFRGVMCYSAREAVHLSGQGCDDLLVAYPVWDESYLREVCTELRRGRTLTLMVDSAEHVDRLEDAARRADAVIPVCLDLDMSSNYLGLHFGVRRSPVNTVEQALALSQRVLEQPHLRLDGVMGYEAQIAGLPDSLPGRPVRSAVLRLLKRRSVKAVADRRAATVAALRERGVALRFVNGGGTGSLETTAAEEAVSEVTAGSGFYSPALFDGYRAFQHLPAAGFAVEITRKPTSHVWTCHGGGLVASGAAGRDRLPLPYLPTGAALTPAEGAGEVQTPVVYRGPEALQLGDPVFMRHAKAGELCEHFDALLLVSAGKIVEEVRTYRGEGGCFL